MMKIFASSLIASSFVAADVSQDACQSIHDRAACTTKMPTQKTAQAVDACVWVVTGDTTEVTDPSARQLTDQSDGQCLPMKKEGKCDDSDQDSPDAEPCTKDSCPDLADKGWPVEKAEVFFCADEVEPDEVEPDEQQQDQQQKIVLV